MSMTVFEVPREHWVEELDAFTLAHEGWLASLEVFGAEREPTLPIDRLPLIGVSADQPERDGTIAISVSRSRIGHITHLIRHVRHLYVEVSVDGTTAGLLIESSHSVRTVVELRATGCPARC